jgi:serine/threonine protein kinase
LNQHLLLPNLLPNLLPTHPSMVRVAQNKMTGQRVAVKCIMKHEVFRERRLLSELLLLRKLKHPNIVDLYDIFETDTEIFLVMQYCEGGELFDRVMTKSAYR